MLLCKTYWFTQKLCFILLDCYHKTISYTDIYGNTFPVTWILHVAWYCYDIARIIFFKKSFRPLISMITLSFHLSSCLPSFVLTHFTSDFDVLHCNISSCLVGARMPGIHSWRSTFWMSSNYYGAQEQATWSHCLLCSYKKVKFWH